MTHQSKSYKKFVATAATATLVATAIAPVASAANFTDVSNDYKVAVDYLTANGIANGLTDTTFGTSQNITRGDAAVMIANALNLDTASAPSAGFTDVNTRVAGAVNAIVYADIASGRTATKFDPAANITRQEMAKMLANAYGLKASTNANFSDVNSNWIGFVSALKEAGITQGKTETTFAPTANLTRGEFALFMYRAKDLAPVSAVVESVNAINNTTVEVVFRDAIEDIKALDFAIEGLVVENAVVKQTNSKAVVLTTSSQEGDKVYTVTENGEKIGTFKGVSAVIPTKVDMTKKSLQGKLGKEVTVTAKVEVPAGQSKAGIPVTFNVPGDDGTLSPKITGEALTDADGVATYSYTRYAARTDEVTAYATGDRSKFSISNVYWAVDELLTVTSVTESATVNNGANKTYKVVALDNNGKPAKGVRLQVSFLENINVPANKLSDAKVNGVTPFELENGVSPVTVEIVTNDKGEATFTVTGSNTKVTPVVTRSAKDSQYKPTDLQVTADTVTFEAIQSLYTLKLERDGGEYAAIGGKDIGGRDYNLVVTDKDGKPAANELVHVAFDENIDRVLATKTSAYFLDNNDVKQDKITVKTNAKGEATFTIYSDMKQDYATPVAWIDLDGSDASLAGQLDEGEPFVKGEMTLFEDAKLVAAKLVVDPKNGVVTGDNSATFKFVATNQSNNAYNSISVDYVEYTIKNTGAENIYVEDAKGDEVTVSPNRHVTVKYPTNKELVVTAKNARTSVDVTASARVKDIVTGKEEIVYAATAKADFVSSKEIGATYTGLVESIDTDKNTITFVGKGKIAYESTNFKNTNGVELSESEFEALVNNSEIATNDITVTAVRNADGKYTLEIVSIKSKEQQSEDTLAMVNKAKDATDIEKALENDVDFGKLSEEAQEAAKAAILANLQQGNTYTPAQLATALKEETYTISGTFVYEVGEETNPTAKKATIEKDIVAADPNGNKDGIKSVLSAKEFGPAYDGFEITFALAATAADNEFKVAVSGKDITVTIPQSFELDGTPEGPTMSFEEIAAAFNSSDVLLGDGVTTVADALELEFTVEENAVVADLDTETTGKTTDGNLGTAVPAVDKLIVTYSSSVEADASGTITVTAEDGTTTATGSANDKEVEFELTTEDQKTAFKASEKVTVDGLQDTGSPKKFIFEEVTKAQ